MRFKEKTGRFFKKWNGRVLLFLLAVSLLCPSATAAATTSSDTSIQVSIGIYDEASQKYILNNTTISMPAGLTLLRTVVLLKRDGLITNFSQNGNELTSVSYSENGQGKVLTADNQHRFYMKWNGTAVSEFSLLRTVSNGDIIEWIYTTKDDYDKTHPQTDAHTVDLSSSQSSIAYWGPKTSKAFEKACDWLALNAGYDENYLIAAGCAGKTADVGIVNNLLAQVKKEQASDTPYLAAGHLLMLGDCGYDSDNQNVRALLYSISGVENLSSYGTKTAAMILLAYDCRDYALPKDAVNSRAAVVKTLLSLQSASGGFPEIKGGNDDLFATSLAVSALSGYIKDANVKTAVDKAVSYLIAWLNPSKYGYSRLKTCGEYAAVITAFTSAGVSITDSRIYSYGMTLANGMLRFAMPDGGFSASGGGQSDISSTEQAVIALSALKKNGNPYHASGPQKPPGMPRFSLMLRLRLFVRQNFGLLLLLFCTLFEILVALCRKHGYNRKKCAENTLNKP